MKDKVHILNIDIDNISKEYLLKNIEGFIVTPNVDHLVKLQKDSYFYQVYSSADYVICDSKVVSIVLKLFNTPVKEVIPGSSFFHDFCTYHQFNNNIKIFLLGAAEGVAQKAMKNINNRIGRNIVVGVHSPSFGFENNIEECLDIINIINRSEANVLLVGVGAPKQEKWIYQYRNYLNNIKIFLPLGATIDFEANNVKRAPRIYQALALEWLYRIFQDPKRLIKRYMIDDMPFFYYILKQKFGLYKNPFKEELNK